MGSFKHEKKVMKKLGFKPQFASGAGWIDKEDGENEIALAQLKSTIKESMSIKLADLNKLVYHANVSEKIPVFVIEFTGNRGTWLMIRPEDLPENFFKEEEV